MTQGLLHWSPCHHSLSLLPISIPTSKHTHLPLSISATLESTSTNTTQQQQHLSARERRQLRNERRESKAGTTNWKEQVEEKLLEKPTQKFAHWKEELNINNLAREGPQWYIVRVSRVKGQETAQLIARLLARNYPHMDFKVYAPSIPERKKLKNGTYSVKAKPLFPGCAFLKCVLDKEIHDFVTELDGVGGFIGAKVGNTKRQINRPRPVSEFDMDAVFAKAKEEQEKADLAFQQEQQLSSGLTIDDLKSSDAAKSAGEAKPKRISRKASDPLINGSSKAKDKKLVLGSTVRVVSGTFAEYEGILKKLNRRTKKATVAFMLFGKESLVDLDVSDIVSETL